MRKILRTKEMSYCECGCGEQIQKLDKRGRMKRFLLGHQCSGDRNYFWKGGKYKAEGYVMVWNPERAILNCGNHVREHIVIAEKILGKPLPPNAVVHHSNGKRSDNRPENLVICNDIGYHSLLHTRKRAMEICGNKNWRKCRLCKRYDSLENLKVYYNKKKRDTYNVHLECVAEHVRKFYDRTRNKPYKSRVEKKLEA